MAEIQATGIETKTAGSQLTAEEFNILNLAVNILAGEAIGTVTTPSHRLLAGLSTGSLYVVNLNAG